MSKITIRDLLMKTTNKYIEKKSQINQDLNGIKKQNIKETIYIMIMKCFEICLPISKRVNSEKYIELANIIIRSQYNRKL